MKIIKKIGYRIYQFCFKVLLPFLPYREPKLLNDNYEIAKILQNAGITNVLFVTDEGIKNIGITKALENYLTQNGIKYFMYDEVVANPTSNNVEEVLNMYLNNKCNAIVAFGGGSVMDCAKAVGARVACSKKTLKQMKGVLKVRKKLPTLIAVPTTAGTGSETTLAAVITDSETRHKYAINDFCLIPKYALLDAKLTLGLPQKITSTTGMDALTHAIEAYIGNSTTKQTRKCALFAVKTIFENILECYNNGQNEEARANMLKASYYAGLAFTKSYVGYVHAIAHSLGGKYNTPHGLANAIILPHMLKMYGKKVYKKLWQMGVYSGLFNKKTPYKEGAEIFIKKIEDLNKQMNIPEKIAEINDEDISVLAKTAEKEANPLYPVPVIFFAKELENVYRKIK